MPLFRSLNNSICYLKLLGINSYSHSNYDSIEEPSASH